MTGQQIITKFENYIGDSLDADFTLQLVNDAKNAIETELELEITKKLNSNSSTTAGQTSTTAINLPSDFFSPLTIALDNEEYIPIPFEKQHTYKNSSGFYWIDHGSSQYHLCGVQGNARTINFYYQKATDDLNTGTSPVWPVRFHSLIPLEMARQYWMIDQGEKSRAWDDRYAAEYNRMKNLMISWDAKLKLAARDNSAYVANDSMPSENHINF